MSPTCIPRPGGNGNESFVAIGIRHSGFGVSIDGAGDINGDGIDDLIVGARYAWPRDEADEVGHAYVIFGRASGFPAGLQITHLFPEAGGDGNEGFVIVGIDAETGVNSANDGGDLNADGIDDLVAVSRLADPHERRDAGEAYVLFGRSTGFPAIFELSRLKRDSGGDGSKGVVLNGIDWDDNLDIASAAGDGSKGVVLNGIDWDDNLDIASAAGDVNHDGIDDLVLGASDADPHGNDRAGEAYVVFGRNTAFPAEIDLLNLMPDGFVSIGEQGRCPDTQQVTGQGLTGNGSVALLASAVRGSDAIASGPCAGTATGLRAPRVLTTGSADAGGRWLIEEGFFREEDCGLQLQIIDAESCNLSDTVLLP